MNIKITAPSPQHVTIARRVGNWITFRCPHCDYVRVINDSTGEMYLRNPGDPEALHSGMSYPAAIDENYSMN
jgi:hypothetical protein